MEPTLPGSDGMGENSVVVRDSACYEQMHMWIENKVEEWTWIRGWGRAGTHGTLKVDLTIMMCPHCYSSQAHRVHVY